jgi:hypothetical protein
MILRIWFCVNVVFRVIFGIKLSARGTPKKKSKQSKRVEIQKARGGREVFAHLEASAGAGGRADGGEIGGV